MNNLVLPSQQVSTYQTHLASFDTGLLVRYFPLYENSGTPIDLSSNKETGASYNGVVLGGNSFINGDRSPDFDGINDNVVTTSNYDTDISFMNKGTIGVWINMASADWTDGVQHTIWMLRWEGANHMFLQKSTTNNQIRFRWRAASVSYDVNYTLTSPSGWIYIVCRWETDLGAGDHTDIFVNGVEVATNNGAKNAMARVQPLTSTIGSFWNSSSEFFDGGISNYWHVENALSDGIIAFTTGGYV